MNMYTNEVMIRIEALEKRVQELEKNQVVAESATSEKKGLEAFKNLVNAEPMPSDFQEVVNELFFDSASTLNQECNEGTYTPEVIDEMLMNMPLTAGLEELKKKEKENSEKPNLQDNYPSHWPRKADGSGVQVGDEIEIITPNHSWKKFEVLKIDYTIERIYFLNHREEKDWWNFGIEDWSDGFQFRFPEEQEKDFDRERALSLLDTIDIEYSDSVSIPEVDRCIEELRDMLGDE